MTTSTLQSEQVFPASPRIGDRGERLDAHSDCCFEDAIDICRSLRPEDTAVERLNASIVDGGDLNAADVRRQIRAVRDAFRACPEAAAAVMCLGNIGALADVSLVGLLRFVCIRRQAESGKEAA